jgi:hypothetical protein
MMPHNPNHGRAATLETQDGSLSLEERSMVIPPEWVARFEQITPGAGKNLVDASIRTMDANIANQAKFIELEQQKINLTRELRTLELNLAADESKRAHVGFIIGNIGTVTTIISFVCLAVYSVYAKDTAMGIATVTAVAAVITASKFLGKRDSKQDET